MFAGTLQEMLTTELAEYLGYEKNETAEEKSTNRRNGSSSKTVHN